MSTSHLKFIYSKTTAEETLKEMKEDEKRMGRGGGWGKIYRRMEKREENGKKSWM